MKLQIINEQEVLGKHFTVYGTADEPLFLAKDVAEWIEHSKPSIMVDTVDEDEKLKKNDNCVYKRRKKWLKRIKLSKSFSRKRHTTTWFCKTNHLYRFQ